MLERINHYDPSVWGDRKIKYLFNLFSKRNYFCSLPAKDIVDNEDYDQYGNFIQDRTQQRFNDPREKEREREEEKEEILDELDFGKDEDY